MRFLRTLYWFVRHNSCPLTDLLKGKTTKQKIVWNEDCEQAFNTLKNNLTKSPILCAHDYSKGFIVQTDASLIGAGIILTQKFSDDEHPILFLSKRKETTALYKEN